MEPYSARARLRPIVKPAELFNGVRDLLDCGLQRSSRRALHTLVLALVVVALPTLFPQTGGASGQIRVFVTESTSWSVSGTETVIEGDGGGHMQGGAKPQTAEIMKTISKRRECAGVVVTINREKADYILLLERVGGRDIIAKDNKMALFNRDGDMVASSSTRSLGNAVKDACLAIQGSY